MSDMVWMNSMAHADGMACSMLPPTSSHAAKHSAGLTRFPPASNEYLQESSSFRASETAHMMPSLVHGTISSSAVCLCV